MSNPRPTILACVDGSLYTDSVCDHAAWASQRLDAPIQLLHVQTPASTYSSSRDLSGALGLGAKSALLEKLTQVDEARGKLDQQKGNLILAHAQEMLSVHKSADESADELGGASAPVETLHRRGSLVETISELEDSAQLIVLGKRGENANFATLHLGSNLERVARAAHEPILVAARAFQPIERFVIAYDGGPSTLKALSYAISSPLLQGLACHLLQIGSDNSANRQSLEEAAAQLTQAGFAVEPRLQQGQADEVIASYVQANDVNLLVMGAYGHSHIRTLIIGSTTSSMLRSCPIPVLMFR